MLTKIINSNDSTITWSYISYPNDIKVEREYKLSSIVFFYNKKERDEIVETLIEMKYNQKTENDILFLLYVRDDNHDIILSIVKQKAEDLNNVHN